MRNQGNGHVAVHAAGSNAQAGCLQLPVGSHAPQFRTEVTIDRVSSQALDYGTAGDFVDIDSDGWPDIYIIKGRQTFVNSALTSMGVRNALHLNSKDGTFKSVSDSEAVGPAEDLLRFRPSSTVHDADSIGNWNVFWADYDNVRARLL